MRSAAQLICASVFPDFSAPNPSSLPSLHWFMQIRTNSLTHARVCHSVMSSYRGSTLTSIFPLMNACFFLPSFPLQKVGVLICAMKVGLAVKLLFKHDRSGIGSAPEGCASSSCNLVTLAMGECFQTCLKIYEVEQVLTSDLATTWRLST